MNRTSWIAVAIAAVVVAVAAITGVYLSGGPPAQAGTRPPAAPCATYDISGHPAAGLPWDEPVTFCGAGVRPGTWTCPAKTPDLGPGARLRCARQP